MRRADHAALTAAGLGDNIGRVFEGRAPSARQDPQRDAGLLDRAELLSKRVRRRHSQPSNALPHCHEFFGALALSDRVRNSMHEHDAWADLTPARDVKRRRSRSSVESHRHPSTCMLNAAPSNQ